MNCSLPKSLNVQAISFNHTLECSCFIVLIPSFDKKRDFPPNVVTVGVLSPEHEEAIYCSFPPPFLKVLSPPGHP
jgi:hypothetical protein